MESKPTVYLVDDDPAILRVLAELVELIELKAECYRSANEFLKTYKPTGPACLVLDVRMPGMSGLELQKELVKSDITLPIIMITGHGDVRMAVEAMSAGALNLLEKPFRTQELCDNIQQAIRIAEERWQHRRQREEFNSLMADLTPAEREVLDLVLAGKTKNDCRTVGAQRSGDRRPPWQNDEEAGGDKPSLPVGIGSCSRPLLSRRTTRQICDDAAGRSKMLVMLQTVSL